MGHTEQVPEVEPGTGWERGRTLAVVRVSGPLPSSLSLQSWLTGEACVDSLPSLPQDLRPPCGRLRTAVGHDYYPVITALHFSGAQLLSHVQCRIFQFSFEVSSETGSSTGQYCTRICKIHQKSTTGTQLRVPHSHTAWEGNGP